MQYPSQEVQASINLYRHPGRLLGHRYDFHWHSKELCRIGYLPHLSWYRRSWILPWRRLSDHEVSSIEL